MITAKNLKNSKSNPKKIYERKKNTLKILSKSKRRILIKTESDLLSKSKKE